MKEKRCQYEGSCRLRSEFGCEVCSICTAGPKRRAQARRIIRLNWLSIVINLTAAAMNIARVLRG